MPQPPVMSTSPTLRRPDGCADLAYASCAMPSSRPSANSKDRVPRTRAEHEAPTSKTTGRVAPDRPVARFGSISATTARGLFRRNSVLNDGFAADQDAIAFAERTAEQRRTDPTCSASRTSSHEAGRTSAPAGRRLPPRRGLEQRHQGVGLVEERLRAVPLIFSAPCPDARLAMSAWAMRMSRPIDPAGPSPVAPTIRPSGRDGTGSPRRRSSVRVTTDEPRRGSPAICSDRSYWSDQNHGTVSQTPPRRGCTSAIDAGVVLGVLPGFDPDMPIVERMPEGGDVAGGEDRRIARSGATRRPNADLDIESRVDRDLLLGEDADADHGEVAGHDFAARQDRAHRAAPVRNEALDHRPHAERYALGLMALGETAGDRRRNDAGKKPVRGLDDRRLEVAVARRRGDFQADEAATDDDQALALGEAPRNARASSTLRRLDVRARPGHREAAKPIRWRGPDVIGEPFPVDRTVRPCDRSPRPRRRPEGRPSPRRRRPPARSGISRTARAEENPLRERRPLVRRMRFATNQGHGEAFGPARALRRAGRRPDRCRRSPPCCASRP